MNLDCLKLSNYLPSQKLFHQLVHYPQEIIPLMDHVLTDFFLERFDDGTLPQGVIMKVRPFNLPKSLNLRELNPESNRSSLMI
jgi:DNA replication licensing factor MCM4